ncbi:MAG: thiamine pyrophosphate-binding protein [Candidatus Micrarchaeota archaeon]|nr:thiamine pyrophosphate-binding protein [Candidatus Micrarchaeota archaeon]
MIKLSDYVFEFIAGLGIKQVFLLPGGGCMHLVDSLGKQNALELVGCLHEQAVSIAADAYSQYTKNIGVALVTTGPGGTNAITGVTASWIDSIPCLIISGQVKRNDIGADKGLRQLGVQEVDIISMVKPITKYAITVLEPKTIRYHLEKAVYLAKSGRPGPVWIDIPLDVQSSTIDETKLEKFSPDPEPKKDLEDKIEQIIKLLIQSKRPVILAGNGIRLGKAEKEFLDLIEILKIPILTTWKAIDIIPDNNKLFFGRPGSIGQRGANFIQQNSDLIISIGARLDLAQVGYSYKNFAREAKKVVIDIDPAEIKKIQFDITIEICADAGNFIRDLIKRNIKLDEKTEWLVQCKKWVEKYPIVLPEQRNQKKYVSTYALIDVLSDIMKDGELLVPGSSAACSEITFQAFRVKKEQRIINSPGLGAMGFGLPASIGACIASGKKRTICINGDGGFQLNIQELATVAGLKLPIKFFILNNDGYSSIKNSQRNYFEGKYVCSDSNSGLYLPNINKVANAYGLTTLRIENNQELQTKIKQAFEIDGPVLCEIMIDPEELTLPRLKSEIKPDGKMVSKPMEDLWPFLPREEFKSEMIIEVLEEK